MTSGQDDRKGRLAQALRDNLRRRKAQAREGAAVESQDHGDEPEGNGSPDPEPHI